MSFRKVTNKLCMNIIEIKNVKKRYNGKQALNVDSLQIKSGECVGVVGNNGAGKSTLFRAIVDLVKPDEGVVWIADEPVQQSQHWKNLLHAFLDESFLISFMRPDEYFLFIGKTAGLNKEMTKTQLARYPELMNEDIAGSTKLIRELSTGSKIRVGILAALLGNPKILILDEPFAHLDPGSQARLGKLLKRLYTEEGMAVLLSSHNLHNIAQVCSRIVLIENGMVVDDRRADEEAVQALSGYFELNG